MYKFQSTFKWLVVDVAKISLEHICGELQKQKIRHCLLSKYNKIILGDVFETDRDALQESYGKSYFTQKLTDSAGKDVLSKLDFRYSFSQKFFERSNAPRTEMYDVKDVVVKGSVDILSDTDLCDHKALDVPFEGYGSFEGTFEELFNLVLDPAVKHIYTK